MGGSRVEQWVASQGWTDSRVCGKLGPRHARLDKAVGKELRLAVQSDLLVVKPWDLDVLALLACVLLLRRAVVTWP